MLLHLNSFVILLIVFEIKLNTCQTYRDVVPWKIYHGVNALTDPKIKHIVSVRHGDADEPDGDDHICGGAIIKPNIILTVARCVTDYDTNVTKPYDAENLYIVAGTPYLYTTISTAQIRQVEDVYVHKNFVPDPNINDLAILKLTQSLEEDEHTVQRVDIKKDRVRRGDICTTYGWGRIDCLNDYTGNIQSNEIQSLLMRVIGLRHCAKIGTGARASGQFCAIEVNQNGQTCNGDSGGPMLCQDGLAALDSTGDTIITNPEYFTSLYNYKSWIENYITNTTTLSFRSGANGDLSLCSVVHILVVVIAFVTFISKIFV